ncbi:hypothetical protein RchiOBHm_Chr4g0415201 [Rosa chinensis]|uniref:Uncharacterized protein n=1 Tax=Rosa chinensis TaxID=74649 RepID=A0A2P6QWJ7_ROSCH|nr:hypothetical protein RchiOBHm_Chr4g0415201 [Rosa chinensis]
MSKLPSSPIVSLSIQNSKVVFSPTILASDGGVRGGVRRGTGPLLKMRSSKPSDRSQPQNRRHQRRDPSPSSSSSIQSQFQNPSAQFDQRGRFIWWS